MEERKIKEIEYYDKETENSSFDIKKESGSRHSFDPFLLESYNFLKNLVKERAENKIILDYGCGTGTHLVWLAQISNRVIGVDLSENSLKLAKERMEKEKIGKKAELLLMDCEKLNFPDNSFDVVFDGGTFSSLDIKKALPEIIRVLKPEGSLVGIETFGHNPLANLKRKLNEKTGKRTAWAAGHIIQGKDLKEMDKYFEETKIHFFHPVSWLFFPFLKFPSGKKIFKVFEKIDNFLLTFLPFLKKYSFKIVFVFSRPKTLKILKK